MLQSHSRDLMCKKCIGALDTPISIVPSLWSNQRFSTVYTLVINCFALLCLKSTFLALSCICGDLVMNIIYRGHSSFVIATYSRSLWERLCSNVLVRHWVNVSLVGAVSWYRCRGDRSRMVWRSLYFWFVILFFVLWWYCFPFALIIPTRNSLDLGFSNGTLV